MIKNGILVLTLLLVCGTAGASGFADLAGEAKIPLANGWLLATDSLEFPFQLVNVERSAELLIFKSVISSDEIIRNEQELKQSVDQVIEDVILTLPQAQLLTNTGVFDENRVWFALDFQSFDEDREIQLVHRLKGVIYRHPDGYQLLFTLWGKAARDADESIMARIRFMQEGFAYYGDAEGRIFGSESSYDWYLIGFLFAMLVVMLFILKRRQRGQALPKFTEDGNFWRCSCGRLNHNENANCRRCGRPQNTEPVT